MCKCVNLSMRAETVLIAVECAQVLKILMEGLGDDKLVGYISVLIVEH